LGTADIKLSPFEKYIAKINDNGQYSIIDTTHLKIDPFIKNILNLANLPASLQPSNSNETDHQSLLNLDAIQSPLLVYLGKGGQYYLISGIFTYHKMLRSTKTEKIHLPAFVLNKPPAPPIRKLIMLNELTRSLLKQFFVNNSPDIAAFMSGWFDTSDHNIFATDEWKALFPKIKNKTQFCRWLGLSSKTFVVK
tara:strand:- start:141008 stop:141589 length:582 start_codon:yes stop_codon:yes gene_type:complete